MVRAVPTRSVLAADRVGEPPQRRGFGAHGSGQPDGPSGASAHPTVLPYNASPRMSRGAAAEGATPSRSTARRSGAIRSMR